MTTDSTITPELLDQLLANTKPEDLTGENGLFKQLKKALIERALGAARPWHGFGLDLSNPCAKSPAALAFRYSYPGGHSICC